MPRPQRTRARSKRDPRPTKPKGPTADRQSTAALPSGDRPAGPSGALTGRDLCDSTSTATRPRAREVLVDQPTEELEAEVIDLSARLSAGTYELLVLVGELDHRGAFAITGALTCAAWLADVCGIELCTARTQVRVARAMRRFAQLDQSMAAGDISYTKARVLTACLTEENVDELIEMAERTSAGRLGAAIAAWSLRNEDPETIHRRQHESRSVTWRTETSGTVLVTARLTPQEAGRFTAAIDSQVMRNDAPAGATIAQQRADALTSLTTDGGAAVSSEVVVHVREDGNTLTDGTPLSDHAVTQLLPESLISLLIHDSERQPIDASPRRRFPTPRQKRVNAERHPECAHPGCHATAFLQHDHIQPYNQGGPTVLDNLQRLCGPHNRAKDQPSR